MGNQRQAVIRIHISLFFQIFSPLLAKSLQSCPTFCNPMDYSPPGSSVHEILQTRILEWVAIPSPRDLPDSGIEPASPALAGRFFTTSTTWEAQVLISYLLYIYICVCVFVCVVIVHVNTNLPIYPFPHIYHICNIPQPYKRIK